MNANNNTFWGLILQPGKRYEQIVEKSFHVSMASLDIASGNTQTNPNTQVMINVDGQEFILCHLNRKNTPQQTLDLNFQGGDSLALYVDGETPLPVHLTGFYNEIDDDDMEEVSDMSDEEEAPQLVPAKLAASLKKQNKGKGDGINAEPAENGSKRKGSPVKSSAQKKAKVQEIVQDEEESDDDDEVDDEEEDDDEEVEEGFSDENEREEEDEEASEEEDDDEDDDDDDEDDEEGEEDDDESDDDEPEIPLKKTKVPESKKGSNAHDVSLKSPKANGPAGGEESPKKKKSAQNANEGQKTPVQQEKKAPQTPKSAKKTIGGGVMIEDLVVGSGPVAKRGRPVSVYYVGRLKQNNKQFDQTIGGPGFKFRLGAKEVIKGWDVGVEGMKVGGKRRITCPPHMAYGSRGSPPVIPPNSALVFEVTLKNVH